MANRKAYPQKSTKSPGTFNQNTKWRRRGTKYPSMTLGKERRGKKSNWKQVRYGIEMNCARMEADGGNPNFRQRQPVACMLTLTISPQLLSFASVGT